VREARRLNHSKFIDDIILLGGASTIITSKYKKEVDIFIVVINHHKSQILGWNAKPHEL